MSLSYANDFQRKYKQEKQNAGMLSTNTGSPLQDINNRNANTLSQLSSFSTPTRQATQQRISEATYTRPNYGSYVGVKSSGNNGASKGSTGSTYTSISNQNIAASQQPTDQPLTSNSTPSTPNAAPSYNNSYQEYLNKIFANAQNAYNNNLNAINSMYGERLNSLNSRYNSGRDTLSATNAQQQEALRKAKEQAQRQAYIQSQEAERDMQQNLSAQGLSGGASESTLASMRNNYASNRNSNEEEYLNNAASLNASYQSELANLENQYQQLIDALNAEKASAIMQNENALANAGTAAINQFADYAYNMDYLNANAALQQQGQKELAAINQQYTLDQMAQQQKNSIDLMQTEYGLKKALNNSKGNIKTSDIRAAYISEKRRQGYSEDEIEKLLKKYNL